MMKYSATVSSLVLALLPSCGARSEIGETGVGAPDTFGTGGAATTGGSAGTQLNDTGGLPAAATGGTPGIVTSNTGGTRVMSTGGAVATGGSRSTGGTAAFATGGSPGIVGSSSGGQATTGGTFSMGGSIAAGTGGALGTDHTTVGAALSQVETALCTRIAGCLGASESTCYDNLVSIINVSPRVALEPEACTNSEIDACVSDIGTMACPASTATIGSVLANLPVSCQNC